MFGFISDNAAAELIKKINLNNTNPKPEVEKLKVRIEDSKSVIHITNFCARDLKATDPLIRLDELLKRSSDPQMRTTFNKACSTLADVFNKLPDENIRERALRELSIAKENLAKTIKGIESGSIKAIGKTKTTYVVHRRCNKKH